MCPKVEDKTDALDAEYVQNVMKTVGLYGDAVFVGVCHFNNF